MSAATMPASYEEETWVKELKQFIHNFVEKGNIRKERHISERFLAPLIVCCEKVGEKKHVVRILGDNRDWEITSFRTGKLEGSTGLSTVRNNKERHEYELRRYEYQVSFNLQQGKQVGILTVTAEIHFEQNDHACVEGFEFTTKVEEDRGDEESITSGSMRSNGEGPSASGATDLSTDVNTAATSSGLFTSLSNASTLVDSEYQY
jgi:hypothetical protein